jgi:leucyl-tRNA synthetase
MDYLEIHKKWRDFWAKNGCDKYDIKSSKPPYYSLVMLPYPSGATLHVGHFFQYALPDTHARFKKMCGFNVFQPMGFDAFGLPAENNALKTDTHPQDNTVKNMNIMKRQFGELGAMYDWDYSFATCFPDYYKWNQWLFLKLYNAGLAYQKEAQVNWCDKCKTVLANEQVLGGDCERCGTQVVRRNMKQWFLKITDYADKLLGEIDGLDWPNKTKVMQKNWIGKSIGANAIFKTENGGEIDVFTTRVDTLSGATFLVLAPEHPAVGLLITKEHEKECHKYIAESAKKSDVERQSGDKEKTGVFTGSFAVNPLNDKKIPIYLADYVLAGYGTGAIMAVPAHDERDEAFAKKYNLEIVHAVDGEDEAEKARVISAVNKKSPNAAKKSITYRLRDWSIGRQRYWGTPIPIVYCDKCGTVPVPECDLPVTLPYVKDFKPRGSAPLAAHPEFHECKCPKCGAPAKRECDTMDTFVCSSWYFLRYQFAKNAAIAFEKNVKRVDVCIGGNEHACGHLIYSRFITRFLYEQGLVTFKEPFPKLIHQGLILSADGTKMSKSKNNFVTPDAYVEKYGSDILRLFMLFGFNFVDGGPWDEGIIKTVTRFTERIETLIRSTFDGAPDTKNTQIGAREKELLYVQSATIKAVHDDLERFSFNTAVARTMEFLNAITDYTSAENLDNREILKSAVKTLVLLVAPMVPHLGEEFWAECGGAPSVFAQPFPTPDKKYLTRDEIEIAVQINSRIVARIVVPTAAAQKDVEKLCSAHTKGKTVTKVVFVKGRLINFIT